MYVNFYKIDKKINSTKRPVNYSYRVNCNLLYPCDILRPTLIITGHNTSTDFSEVNYCYISDFNRYYWITDKLIFNAAMQEYTLQVDVLATYRPAISNYSGQLARTSDSNKYNLNVVDNMLIPTTGLKNEITINSNTNPFSSINGSVSFLYYGEDGGGYINARLGSNSTVANRNINNIMESLFAYNDFWQNWVVGETNPSQYIRDLIYIPLQVTGYGDPNIYIGSVEAEILDSKVLPTDTTNNGRLRIVSMDIPLTSINEYNDFRDYDNKFTTCKLEAPFLGLLNIDAKYLRYDTLTIQYKVDMATADCIITVIATRTGGVNIPITQLCLNIGSSVPAGFTTLKSGAIKSIISGLTDNIVNNMEGSVSGSLNMLNDTMVGISTGFQSMNCLGGSGSFADYYSYPCSLHIYRQGSTSNATDERGKPAMGGAEAPTLNHYNQYANPHLSLANATLSEAEEVNSYMSTGFYYE